MEVFHAQKRLYPQNQLAAHVIGYTGEISEKELDTPEFASYEQAISSARPVSSGNITTSCTASTASGA